MTKNDALFAEGMWNTGQLLSSPTNLPPPSPTGSDLDNGAQQQTQTHLQIGELHRDERDRFVLGRALEVRICLRAMVRVLVELGVRGVDVIACKETKPDAPLKLQSTFLKFTKEILGNLLFLLLMSLKTSLTGFPV